MESANLGGADFRGANLSQSDLRSADLRRTQLSDVDLSGANLFQAILFGARVDAATDFAGTNLQGTDMRVDESVNSLSTATFDSNTSYDSATLFPVGFDPDAHGLTYVPEPSCLLLSIVGTVALVGVAVNRVTIRVRQPARVGHPGGRGC